MTKAEYQTWYRATPKGKALRKQYEKTSRIRLHAKRLEYGRLYRFKKYGITKAMYDSMVSEQDGRCRLCREAKPLSIDHDHKTGRVRSLLCRHCNSVVVRLVENNYDLVERARLYLEEHYAYWLTAKV